MIPHIAEPVITARAQLRSSAGARSRDPLAHAGYALPTTRDEKKGGIIDLSFWRMPERLFDEPDEFVAWAHVVVAAAHRIAANRSARED